MLAVRLADWDTKEIVATDQYLYWPIDYMLILVPKFLVLTGCAAVQLCLGAWLPVFPSDPGAAAGGCRACLPS